MSIQNGDRPRVLLVARCFVRLVDKRFLLIQRSNTDSHHPGLWECPGGKLEEGQDLSHAVEEEAMQEAGLAITVQSSIAFVESFIVSQGKYAGLPYVGMFYIGHAIGETNVRLSEEHEAFMWVGYESALLHSLTPQTRKALLALKPHFV